MTTIQKLFAEKLGTSSGIERMVFCVSLMGVLLGGDIPNNATITQA